MKILKNFTFATLFFSMFFFIIACDGDSSPTKPKDQQVEAEQAGDQDSPLSLTIETIYEVTMVQEGYFTFEVETAGKYLIEATELSVSADIDFTLYGSVNFDEIIDNANDTSKIGESLTKDLSVGTYGLMIDIHTDGVETISFELKITLVEAFDDDDDTDKDINIDIDTDRDSDVVSDDTALNQELEGVLITRSGDIAVNLSPSFITSITEYTAQVDASVSSVSILATSVDHLAMISINNSSPSSPGFESSQISLDEGENIINITVTKDNSETVYTIVITRGNVDTE